jgi:hypothetical protein
MKNILEQDVVDNVQLDSETTEEIRSLIEQSVESALQILENLSENLNTHNVNIPDEFLTIIQSIKDNLEDLKLSNLVSEGDISLKLKIKKIENILNEKLKKKKRKKKKRASRAEKNLYLDRPTSHGGWPDGHPGSYTDPHTPVYKQISGYLKSMGLLEKSTKDLEENILKSEMILKKIDMFESKIIKKKFKGKSYSSTKEMIRAVNLFERGKITYSDLLELASWSQNPEDVIKVSQMIAGTGIFKN